MPTVVTEVRKPSLFSVAIVAVLALSASMLLTSPASAADAPSVDIVLRTLAPDGTTAVTDGFDQAFSGPSGAFSLDTDPGDGDAITDRADFGLTVGAQTSFTHAPAAGYELVDISCNGGAPQDIYTGGVLVGTEVTAATSVEAFTCFFDIRQVAPASLTLLLRPTSVSDLNDLGALSFTLTDDSSNETVTLDDLDADPTYPDRTSTTRTALVRQELRADALPSGWTMTMSCSGDLTSRAVFLFDADGRRVGAAFTAEEGGAVTCQAYIGPALIVSAFASDGAGGPTNLDITFEGDLGTFTIDAGRSSPDRTTSHLIEPGVYEIRPNTPDGWRLTTASCSGVSSSLVESLYDADGTLIGVRLTSVVNSWARCGFSFVADTGRGDVLIVKRWKDGSNNLVSADTVADKVVHFTGDLGDHTIDFDGSDPTYPSSVWLRGIDAATYEVFEAPSTEYELIAIECPPEAGVDATVLTDPTGAPTGVRIPVGGGDTWSCSFTNRLPFVSLNAVVYGRTIDGGTTVSPDLTLRLTDGSGAVAATMLGDSDFNDGDDVWRLPVATPLDEGAYTLTAVAPPGYEVTWLYCRERASYGGVLLDTGITDLTYGTDADGNPTAAFQLGEVPNPLATNTCEVRYQELPSGELTIVKRTQTSDGLLVADPEAFTMTSAGAFGTHVLDTDPSTAPPDRVTVRVPTGQHTITELPSDLWLLSDVTCTGGNPVTVTDGAGQRIGVTVSITNNADVTCSFTNTSDVARIVVEKVTLDEQGNPTTDPQAFTFTAGVQSTTASSAGTGGLLSVDPGPVTIVETAVTGWVYAGTTCIDLVSGSDVTIPAGTNGFDLTVAPGDRLRCTVTNQFNPDRDGDGVPDPEDNCPDHANPDQTDWDRDGIGLACDPDDDRLPSGDPRSQGFWKKAFSDQGAAKFDDATLQSYLDAISSHSTIFVGLTIEDARAILEARGDMATDATAQALAAWLNWANDGVTFYAEVAPGLRFGEAIDGVEAVLADPGSDHHALEGAKDIAEMINLG